MFVAVVHMWLLKSINYSCDIYSNTVPFGISTCISKSILHSLGKHERIRAVERSTNENARKSMKESCSTSKSYLIQS